MAPRTRSKAVAEQVTAPSSPAPEPQQPQTSSPPRPRVQPPVSPSDYGTSSTGTPCMSPVAQLQHSWSRLRSQQPDGKGILATIKFRLKTLKLQSDFLMGRYVLDWYEAAVVYSIYILLLYLVIAGAHKQLVAGSEALAAWMNGSSG